MTYILEHLTGASQAFPCSWAASWQVPYLLPLSGSASPDLSVLNGSPMSGKNPPDQSYLPYSCSSCSPQNLAILFLLFVILYILFLPCSASVFLSIQEIVW